MSGQSKSILVGLLSTAFVLGPVLAEERPSSWNDRTRQPIKFFKQDVNLKEISLPSAITDPAPQSLMEIIVEDVVAYVADAPFEEMQTTTEVTSSAPRPGIIVVAIGDIREINGRPVKGTYAFRATPILTTPTPGPGSGISIADSTRIAQLDHTFEIFQEDGTPIGSIFGYGLGLGPPGPGSPPGSAGGALAVIGGTGPYLAMQGQINTGLPVGDAPFLRFASVRENPAVRRLNGGGITRFLFHLVPRFAPHPVMLTFEPGKQLPAVFHSSTKALVTVDDPAVPGEVLSALVRNLGPTDPVVFPGQPFTRNPANVTTAPIEIWVNGEAAEVTFSGGEPGAVNVFEVEFRVPNGASSGRADVRVDTGFLPGSVFPLVIE